MPVTPTYPGVYLEEIPSGVRTIVGVATSITAFLGRARRGPSNKPITISSFGDFEQQFGKLHVDDPMGYAVRDFYMNGGGQAIIVRLFASPDATDGKSKLAVGNLQLEALSQGSWGNDLSARADYNGIDDDSAAQFQSFGLTKDDLFNLTVEEESLAHSAEFFPNLSVKDGPRRVDRVLAQESQLIRVVSGTALPAARPAEGGSSPAAGGVESAYLKGLDYQGDKNDRTGIYALDGTDLVNLLCIPPDRPDGDTTSAVYQSALAYCTERRTMIIVDPPAAWSSMTDGATADQGKQVLQGLNLTGTNARNAAFYYPRVTLADPLRKGQERTCVPCGIVAGIMAQTDARRGVWKAPAGIDAGINGIQRLEQSLTDEQNGYLNPLGINCLRSFAAIGCVVWGARTLRGADQLADEYKYIHVRRLALFIEETLYRALKWVVFEPNDEPLWAQIRLNVGAFMHDLFRQSAFQGSTPKDSYFVKCDGETTTQTDRNLGIVNIWVGFAPLKPAEFVIIKLQQMAGQIQV